VASGIPVKGDNRETAAWLKGLARNHPLRARRQIDRALVAEISRLHLQAAHLEIAMNGAQMGRRTGVAWVLWPLLILDSRAFPI